ncbi:methyltransferase domain-containing protein [Larkinella bovis]|uniref:Methyltransferase domain-containing protein n=1 Tax=Larkinella bovis TaxID=683041 RepID=A0ABW0IL42_9BACT
MIKRMVINLLDKFGFIVFTKKTINNYKISQIEEFHSSLKSKGDYLKAHSNGGLREKLLSEKKTRWLEIGCGGTFDDYFTYIDLFPETLVTEKGRYYRMDIVNATDTSLSRLGKFDLIRLQHVFEHFTPESGRAVLDNCAKLLNKDGYILISTPDLKKYISFYLSGKIRENYDWALNRIHKDSPNSFYFSIFSHSVPFEKHEWCYDAEGLIYQLEQCGKFKNIREVTLGDELANIPFTHNRPSEDVCVVGQLR